MMTFAGSPPHCFSEGGTGRVTSAISSSTWESRSHRKCMAAWFGEKAGSELIDFEPSIGCRPVHLRWSIARRVSRFGSNALASA